MSHWACTLIFYSVLRQKFAHLLCHYAEWFLTTAWIPSLSSNLSESMSTRREGISRNRITFLIKLCYPEPAVCTLPLTGHRCFNFSDLTYNTALPFNGRFHHIWSAGRWIGHLYDWMVWDLTKCPEFKHYSTDICTMVHMLEDSNMDVLTLPWKHNK